MKDPEDMTFEERLFWLVWLRIEIAFLTVQLRLAEWWERKKK